MIRIAPSILTADFGRLREEIEAAEAAGADTIHLDVMDGRFVPNITFGPLVVAAVRQATRLPLDVHLMIERPQDHLEAFAEAGADTLTVHLEAEPHLHRALEKIHQLGKKAGVAINPATPVSLLEDAAPHLDLVLLMTVNPGFGGQSFIPETVPKFRALRSLLGQMGLGRAVEVEADGAIDEETAPQVVRAGATILVTGSSVYRKDLSVGEAIQRLRRAIPAGLKA